jgi:hypothetical protein
MKPLSEVISIKGRFHRSVNLVGDWGDGGASGEYLLTPTIRELAEYMLGELARPGGLRAWSVTGPFGSGKSAFGLFLTECLCGARPSTVANEIREGASLEQRRFEPVLLTAERGALAPALVAALKECAASRSSKGTAKRRSTAHRLGGTEIADLLLSTAATVRRRRRAGLVVVIDELGKFLEHAVLHPNDADVFVLQQLAEAAARSSVPILLVTILHSGFADYLPPTEDVRRNEWQKVQGRFQDVPFQLPPEQVLELVGTAIESPNRGKLVTSWNREFKAIVGNPGMAPALERLPHSKLLRSCLPLHPLTALILWPLFRSKGAQNERSLFSFLSSEEPLGFVDFLRRTDTDHEARDLYRLPELYDYITAALGLGLFRGEQSRRWSLIDHALSRLPGEAPAGTADVIKSVGL